LPAEGNQAIRACGTVLREAGTQAGKEWGWHDDAAQALEECRFSESRVPWMEQIAGRWNQAGNPIVSAARVFQFDALVSH
jgi:hypothetical protein